MTNQEKLLRLRLELYTAAQLLKGEELAQFRSLLDEVREVVRVLGGDRHIARGGQ